MRPNKAAKLIEFACRLAAENLNFQAVLGPGAGDRATHAFMRRLRETALQQFQVDYSEKKICGANSLTVDFYFPDEETIVEAFLTQLRSSKRTY